MRGIDQQQGHVFSYISPEQRVRKDHEHFTVDGSLLEAWASAKSFQPKNKKGSPPPDDPGNPTVDLSRREALERNAQVEKCGQPGVGSHRHGRALYGLKSLALT
jgi:hypothetical protein